MYMYYFFNLMFIFISSFCFFHLFVGKAVVICIASAVGAFQRAVMVYPKQCTITPVRQ